MDREKILLKRIRQAIDKGRMIEPRETVLLGLSGGKDSLTLARLLPRAARGFDPPFKITAVHVANETAVESQNRSIADFSEESGIPCEIKHLSLERLQNEGKEINCFFCSRERRRILFAAAVEKGIRTVILGHHMDDILESFLMNLLYMDDMGFMLPVKDMDKFGIRIVRPLALAEENEIRRFAAETGQPALACACPFEKESSKRKAARRVLETMVAEAGKGSRFRIYKTLLKEAGLNSY